MLQEELLHLYSVACCTVSENMHCCNFSAKIYKGSFDGQKPLVFKGWNLRNAFLQVEICEGLKKMAIRYKKPQLNRNLEMKSGCKPRNLAYLFRSSIAHGSVYTDI